ncbi:unnamed protein product [Rhizophagus irregularis]|nr:unnamed protein product [Rhizophagus irregularis]CAB5356948.1 unnamed protein product [Rhizophagus irregularis]
MEDLEGENHILVSFKEHSHSPEANRMEVVRTLNTIKESASHTHDRPVQLIQDAVVNMHQSSYSYMPNKQALGKQISRIRNKNMPPQPQELDEINVPNELRRTINNEEFLAREIEFNEEKMMIFCTTSKFQYLQDAEYWLMDGTFKTVPLLFQQMYTIHAPVGGENARVLPLVYVLITGKSKECYTRLFQELISLSEAADVILNPSFIITDFEQAAINASQAEFPRSHHKACFFHMCQNMWRKIQASGLAIEYGTDEELSIKLRYLTALAFLPASDIPNAFDQIKPMMPSNAEAVVQYFEDYYVRGTVRRAFRNGSEVRNPPSFPPSLWSVYELNENNHPRTQNFVERWHQRWLTLLGKHHVGVYTIIKEMRNEQHQTELQIERILRGEPLPNKCKHQIDRENRILTVCNNRDNYTLVEYLRGIAHNICL